MADKQATTQPLPAEVEEAIEAATAATANRMLAHLTKGASGPSALKEQAEREAINALRIAISTALAAAERRGIERAAHVVWDFVSEKLVPTAADIRQGIATAIRSLTPTKKTGNDPA